MAEMLAKFRACTIMPVVTSPFWRLGRALLYTGKRDTITRVAIQGFKCADTQEPFETDRSQQFGSIRKLATRKLGMLDAAATLKDLQSAYDLRKAERSAETRKAVRAIEPRETESAA